MTELSVVTRICPKITRETFLVSNGNNINSHAHVAFNFVRSTVKLSADKSPLETETFVRGHKTILTSKPGLNTKLPSRLTQLILKNCIEFHRK